jgi:hypothetical protein
MRYYFIIILLMMFTNTSTVYAEDNVFDPDGYYYPLELFDIRGMWIERLDVTAIGHDDDENKIDRTRSGSPEIFVILTRRNNVGDMPFRCVDAIVEPDRFHAVCEDTLIGDIMFDGEFIDKSGRFWDHISDSKTPVLKATVTVTAYGGVIHEREYIFGYWEGD